MRKFLTLVVTAIISVVALHAQEPIMFSGVQKAEGLTATQLFTNCNAWVAKSFVSANDVVQMSSDNIVIAKALHTYDVGASHCTLNFTLKVECRDGRYKWTFDQFKLSVKWMTNPKDFIFGALTTAPTTDLHKGFFGRKRVEEIWTTAKEEAENLKTMLSTSLAEGMTQSNTEEDW